MYDGRKECSDQEHADITLHCDYCIHVICYKIAIIMICFLELCIEITAERKVYAALLGLKS